MDVLVYGICLGVGLLFTLVSAIMGHLFGGGDAHAEVGSGGHADAGFDQDGMPGISILSPTMMAAFITAFGAFGLIFSKVNATASVWISAPLAVGGGLVVAAAIFWLFHLIFKKTQSSSESRVARLIGLSATIITPIPANGVGEIAYVDNGTRYTAPARTEDGTAVAAGRSVAIVRTGSQFYVMRMD